MRRYIVLLLITGTVWAQPQAVLDAKKDAKKWTAYPLLVGLTFASSIYGTMTISREEPWESLPAMIGISIASLAVPYQVLNNLDKN